MENKFEYYRNVLKTLSYIAGTNAAVYVAQDENGALKIMNLGYGTEAKVLPTKDGGIESIIYSEQTKDLTLDEIAKIYYDNLKPEKINKRMVVTYKIMPKVSLIYIPFKKFGPDETAIFGEAIINALDHDPEVHYSLVMVGRYFALRFAGYSIENLGKKKFVDTLTKNLDHVDEFTLRHIIDIDEIIKNNDKMDSLIAWHIKRWLGLSKNEKDEDELSQSTAITNIPYFGYYSTTSEINKLYLNHNSIN